MVLVIRRVEVLAIPARRVDDIRANTTQTRHCRETLRVQLRISARRSIIAAEVRTRVASEAGLIFIFRFAAHGVADEHAEAGLEGCHRVLLGSNVVDGYAAAGLSSEFVIEEEAVGDLGDALESSVASLEVEVGGPVVG